MNVCLSIKQMPMQTIDQILKYLKRCIRSELQNAFSKNCILVLNVELIQCTYIHYTILNTENGTRPQLRARTRENPFGVRIAHSRCRSPPFFLSIVLFFLSSFYCECHGVVVVITIQSFRLEMQDLILYRVRIFSFLSLTLTLFLFVFCFSHLIQSVKTVRQIENGAANRSEWEDWVRYAYKGHAANKLTLYYILATIYSILYGHS